MRQEPVNGLLPAVNDIEDTIRQPGLGPQLGELDRGGWILLRRLENEGVPAGDGYWEHPHGHHSGKLNGVCCDHAQRLPHR
jgi:hypothetical protein